MINELLKANKVLEKEREILSKTADVYMQIVKDIMSIQPVEMAGIPVIPASKLAEVVENGLKQLKDK